MRKLGDRCDDNKGVRDKDECGQKMRDGEESPLLCFFFWLDNYAFRRFLTVAMGAVMSATAVLPVRADKRNGRRDCDDEYGWGMRDGK